MGEFQKLQPAARGFVALVVSAGAVTLVYSVHNLLTHPISSQWFILAALTILTGSFSVRVPAITAYLSVSETFVFASVLMFGPSAGTLTVLLETLVILFWMDPRARPMHRIAFNMAAPAVAIWLAGTAFYLFSGLTPYSKVATPPPLGALFLPLLGFTAFYFLLNSWLVAIAVGLESRKPAAAIWWENFAWLSVNYFSGASVSALLVTYGHGLDASTLAVIVPLLVVSYLTFRTAMGRTEDSNSHLVELNRLHLSTIETLAMAIDAKDQITHGHIRRVQVYAMGLAKELGISDPDLIKAIEASALLHDMGKLAVPEYILNKPGKLTAAEFEKMKLHASAGADILSAVGFPYPVVPIVRHHHENWDGTGYPDGIKGTEIPIGARILSVVDCFDALTSDRPYRPQMSNEEALKILMDRRGSMYDPLIVDTFTRVHREIAPAEAGNTVYRTALTEITKSSASISRAPQGPDRPSPLHVSTPVPLTGVSTVASGDTSAGHDFFSSREIGELVVERLRVVVPFSDAVIFLYDIRTDDLVALYASGETVQSIFGLRIPLGQRLSGWVGANRQTIVNSDPALDLSGTLRGSGRRLRSCLSTPLLSEDQLVGVLTLYAGGTEAFTDEHRRIIENAATKIALALATSSPVESEGEMEDSLTTSATFSGFRQVLELIGSAESTSSTKGGFLIVDTVNLRQVVFRYGRSAGDELLRHVTGLVRECLRSDELLFRCNGDELVALLSETDSSILESIAERVRRNIASRQLFMSSGDALTAVVDVRTGVGPFRVAEGRTRVADSAVSTDRRRRPLQVS